MGLLRDAGETISATQSGGVGFLQQSGAKSLSDVVITPTKKKTATKTIEIKKPTLSENIKKSISSGLKMIPGQVKQAGGIMLTSMKQQSERVAQFFTSRYSPLKADPLVKVAGKSIEVGSGIAQKIAPTEAKRGERVLQEVLGVIDRGITSAGKATESKTVGLREQGQKEMMKVQKEYAEGYIPTEGLGRYLEMAAFNLPQLATTVALTAATAFVTKNPAAATAVGLSTSYGLGATEVYSQARADGLTDNEALPLAQIGGAIIGAIDFLPVGKLLRKAGIGKEVQRQVTKSFVRKVSSAIVSIGSQAGFEGITEGLQEVVGNIAQATYKENQDMLEGVKEAIFVGTLLGGFADVTLQTVMSATGQKDTDRFVAEVEEKFKEALETSPENRTETEQMIVDSLTERVLEPREAIALVTAYNLDSTTPADGKLIIQQALKAQQTGQNIRITPSQDGKGEVKVEIVDRDTSETPDEMWDSLLMSNEAQRIAEEDTKESQKARKELQEMEEGIEEKRGSEEVKAQELDQFTSEQVKAMRTIKRSVEIYENKGQDPTNVESLEVYKRHIDDIMSILGTTSETDALDYIRNKLPEPKETVTTREDIERKREVTSRIKPKEVVVPKSKKAEKKPVGERAKPKKTVIGSTVRKVPSIKADKVWRSVTQRGKLSDMPILNNVNVKGGKMLMSDLSIWTEVNTDMKDGMYQVVGKDLVPQSEESAEDFPLTPETDIEYGKVIDTDMAGIIKDAFAHVSTDESRPILTAIRLEFGDNQIRVISTDGFKLINKSIKAKVKQKGVIQLGATKKLNQVFSDVLEGGGEVAIKYNKKDNFVSFENNNGKIVVREIIGDYPTYEKIYPKVNRSIVVDKKELTNAIKEIIPYAKDAYNYMTHLRIEPTKLTLYAKIKDGAEKSVDIDIKDSSKKELSGLFEGSLVMPLRPDPEVPQKNEIRLNYKYIQDVLKANAGDDVHISYVTEKGATTTRPVIFSEEALVDYQKKKEVAEPIKEVKAPQGTSQANMDRYRDIKELTTREGYYKAIQFPELVRMMRQLLGSVPSVEYPRIRGTLGGRPTGLFRSRTGTKEGAGIILNPDLFISPEQAVKTFAHELGHLADWLPDYTHKRGNLIGHVASLNGYLNHTFAGYMKQNRISDLKQKRMILQDKRRTINAIAKEEGKKVGKEDKVLLEEIKTLNKEIKRLEKNPKLVLEDLKNELKAVTQTWKPFDDTIPEDAPEALKKQLAGYIKYRYNNKELYADAISMLFNDPALLKQTAPTFWDGFFASLDRKPEVKKTYFDMMDLLNKGEKTILSEREREIREMFKKGEDLHRTKLEEAKLEKYNIAFKLKHEIIDKNQAVIDRVNKLTKEGKAVADEDNPIYYLEENNYVGGVVKSWLEKNMQPIYTDLQTNEVSWEDFGEALFLERVIKERGGTRNPIKMLRELDNEVIENGLTDFIEDNKDNLPEDMQNVPVDKLLDQMEKKTSDEQLKWLKAMFDGYKTNPLDVNSPSMYDELIQRLPMGIANPLGYDVETAQTQLDYLKSQVGKEKYAVIERNLTDFRRAVKELIPKAYKAGLYKKELAEKMIVNEGYATFQVLDYMDTYIPASVKQQVGTLKDVANPAGSTILKAVSTIRAIEKNQTKSKLVDFLQRYYPEDIQDARTMFTGKIKLPIDPKERGLEMIVVMEQGRLKGYYVDPYIASTVNYMGTGHTNAVLSVFRFMNTKLFKPLFTTYNLGFQTFNLFRDFMRYYKNIPGYNFPKALARYAQALPHAKNRAWGIPDALIQEMEENKILGITYNDVVSGLTDEDRQVDSVLKRYGLAKDESSKRALFKIPLAIMDQIARTGNFIETIPKVAGYKELNGKMPPKQMRSFIRTSVGSPDFLRKGAGYGWYNEIFLYSNAMKEGVRADYNVAFKNPQTRAGWMFKTMAFTLLPKLIMFAGLLGLFGDDLKEMLEKASEYDKTNYTIIPLGLDENGRAIYMRVPQDETGRFIGGFFWKSLNLTQEKSLGVDDIAEIMSYTGGQVPSLSPAITSLFATTQFLAGNNPYDFFRGRPVIPDTEFEAGGMNALKPFVTWQLNQLGGGIFWKTFYTTQAPETETWLQKTIQAPLVSNIIGRWIKVSDYGQLEKNREIIAEQKKKSAQESLRRRELIDKYVEAYRKDKTDENRRIQRDKLIEETLGHKSPRTTAEKTLRTNTVKKFNIAILEGEADANLNALIDAYTNDQKIEMLKTFKDTMDKDKYDKLLRTARENKIISSTVYLKAR
jgi:DNA polymerase III sliding clamp (beta) subunit (PCNA family)